MGKHKSRDPIRHSNHHDNPAARSQKRSVSRRAHPELHGEPLRKLAKRTNGSVKIQSNQRPIIPFAKHDRVLLVGEGNFTFAKSLVRHHGLGEVVATCYDTEEQLFTKYPEVEKTLRAVTEVQDFRSVGIDPAPETAQGTCTIDDTTGSNGSETGGSETSFSGFSPTPPSPLTPDEGPAFLPHSSAVTVIYGIDATKLSTTHRKVLRSGSSSGFSKIVFNFPHVGGLSTDVNRQVRANQELLVGFMKAAVPLLSSAESPVNHKSRKTSTNGTRYDSDHEYDSDGNIILSPTADADLASQSNKPQILITMFEGQPYELWNIRDLARHCGLKVVTSFRFPWSEYPGYMHARTIGEIKGQGQQGGNRENGDDRSKRAGAWRGEERAARTFVLEVKAQEGKEAGLDNVKTGTASNMVPLGQRDGAKKKGTGKDDSDSDSN